MNLQDVNFQRCKHAFHQRQERVELQLALHLLSLTILQLCHLLPPLPPPVSSSSCQFTRCQTHCQLVYWTTVLFKVPYCRIKNDFFNFLCIFLCYYLCACILAITMCGKLEFSFCISWYECVNDWLMNKGGKVHSCFISVMILLFFNCQALTIAIMFYYLCIVCILSYKVVSNDYYS